MIETLTLQNFRGHEATTVPLSPFTLIYGDNATGKTSILEALQLLSDSFHSPPHQVFAEDSAFKWLVRSGNPSAIIQAGVQAQNSVFDYEIRFNAAGSPESVRGVFVKENKPFHLPALRKDSPHGLTAQHRQNLIVEVGKQLTSLSLELEARHLALPSTSDDEVPRVGPDGTGLATALQYLKLTDLPRFERFQAFACNVIPQLVGVAFARTKKERQRDRLVSLEGRMVPITETESIIADQLLLRYKSAIEFLPAHTASEGTLLVLGLLAVLFLPNRPQVILIDDIDRALHPRAQADLVKMIRAVLAEAPDLQVIATSHSPYLADSFKPEEVVVLGRPHDGPVVARRLSDHPDKKLSKVLSTGEFLTASGPEWFGKLAP